MTTCPDCSHDIDRHGWSGCASLVASDRPGPSHMTCPCALKPSGILTARVAEVEQERDEWETNAWHNFEVMRDRALAAEAEVAALRGQVEAVRGAVENVITDNGLTHVTGHWVVKVEAIRAALDAATEALT